ncbi:MAG: hypothetical protein QHH27_05230 [Clostridia bacterium]|nr:hypothetical protein [Clostridia bacterium]MDH7572938.1 hypothetical protein [Clostridia bacterium]
MAVIRWPVILLAFGLTLAILAGAYRLYQEYGVEHPLERRVAATGLAEDVSWQPEEKELAVRLRPVSDLREAYGRLEAAAGQGVSLRVLDRPNAKLEAVCRRVEPALYEAAALNSYVALAERVEAEATRAGLDGWSVQVDEQRIYLALREGEAFIYRIVAHR